MVLKFIRKPVIIEAVQWSGNSNKSEIDSFVGKELKVELESETAYVAGQGAPIFSLLIETKDGVMKAFRGDWIIKEQFPTGDRDFYPCKPEIFKSTYEPLDKGEPITGQTCVNTGGVQSTRVMYVGYIGLCATREEILKKNCIRVYQKIKPSWFKRMMMEYFFGFIYVDEVSFSDVIN